MATTPIEIRAPKTRGRARRSWRQLWQAPIFLLGVSALSVVAWTEPPARVQRPASFEAEVQALIRGLTNHHPADTLTPIADSLAGRLTGQELHEGQAHFLIGSVHYRRLEKAPSDVEVSRLAHFHLERALAFKTLEGAELAQLQFRLGHVLLQQETDAPRALHLIRTGLEAGVGLSPRDYGVLALACMKQPEPDWDAALAATVKQLAGAENDAPELARIRLLRGQILIGKQQWSAALSELEMIRTDLPSDVLAQVRLSRIECAERENLWLKALEGWRELQGSARYVPGGQPRIHYGMGLCYSQLDPPQMNDAIRVWQQAYAKGREEKLAAGLRLGHAYLFGIGDAAKALETWTQALADIQSPADYQNAYLSLAQAQDLLEQGCKVFLESKRWELTEQCAELTRRIAPAGSAEERIAEANEALAKDLATTDADRARAKFNQSAIGFELAALNRSPADQARAYWRSGVNYLLAKNYTGATGPLEKFVKLEPAKSKLAEGYHALAEAFAGQGLKDKAKAAFYQSIQQGNTVFAAKSRYQLALLEIDAKQIPQAISILQQNLSAGNLVQDRPTQEKSLFKIARLYWEEEDYDLACFHLQKAVNLYPHHPDIAETRDLLGRCHRKLADKSGTHAAYLKKPLQLDQTPEAKKAREEMAKLQDTQQRDHRRKALEAFQTLVEDLDRKSRTQPLTGPELNLFLGGLMNGAELAYEQGDYHDAIVRYQYVHERYRSKIESVLAFQRMFACYVVMDDKTKVQAIVKKSADQALADLRELPADHEAFRVGAGEQSRDAWLQWFQIVVPAALK